jgi:hypothetical protein
MSSRHGGYFLRRFLFVVQTLRRQGNDSKTTEASFYVQNLPGSTEKEGKAIEFLQQKKATMALSRLLNYCIKPSPLWGPQEWS